MSKIWLIGGGAFVVVLLVAAVAVALTQREEPLTEGTPERTVQQYLTAIQDDDFRVAHDLLSEKLRAECSIEEFASEAYGYRKTELSSSRVTLEDTKHLDGTAVVIARVTQVRGNGPFGTSEYSQRHPYSLTQEEGDWRFSDYPWPHYGCPTRPAPVYVLPPTPTPVPVPTRTATPGS